MKASFTIIGVVALALFSVGTAQGALIGTPITYPELVTYSLQVDYVAGSGTTGTLTAVGSFDQDFYTAMQVYAENEDPDLMQQYLGSFSLTAEIDKATRKAVGGSLAIYSDSDWDGVLEQRAYSNNLLQFGYDSEGTFDFRFRGTGEFAAPIGGMIKLVLFSWIDGEPTFYANFSNAGDGKADIPEPGTMSLVIFSGLAVLNRRRKAVRVAR